MAAVVPYAFCARGERASLRQQVAGGGSVAARRRASKLVAFVFAVFTLYGCGAEPVLYGTVLLILSIPIYVWQKRRA